MRRLRLFAILAFSGALFAAACADDDNTVRPRLDGGAASAPTDGGGDGAPGPLACGVTVPTTYESPAFATNAAREIALAKQFDQIEEKMKSTEGTSTTKVTAAELKTLFSAGSPSLQAVATGPAQTLIAGYFDAFGDAVGSKWVPTDADKDGGAEKGGKYNDTYHFGPTGVDLREAVQKTILGGALYNHVVGVVSGPISEGTVDQLLAAFGASTAFAHRSDADAGADADKLVAEYAAKRDDKASPNLGPYRKVRAALLTMKVAAPAGDKCKTELDEAIKSYLAEWEKASYATAIYYLNAAALTAADPQKGPQALHQFSEALGFIQSFKGVAQDRRKITDAQIDALSDKVGATTAYKLVTAFGDRVLKLNEAVNDIGAIYGFSPAEIESFKKNY